MATLAEFIKKLAEKSGNDINTEEFKALLEAVQEIKIPENTDLLSAFITKVDAKNDPEIKSHYYAMLANQFDDANLKAFGDLGLDKAIIDEVKKSEPNSFKKINLLTDKAKEYIKQIADPSTLKGEKAELLKKLELVEKEKEELKGLYESEKAQLVKRTEDMQLDYFLEREARDFKLINIPYRDTIVKQSISKALEENGVKLVFKDGKPTLVRSEDPTLSPKEGVTIRSIIEKGFANDQLLDLGNTETEKVPQKSSAVTVVEPKGSTTLARNASGARELMGLSK